MWVNRFKTGPKNKKNNNKKQKFKRPKLLNFETHDNGIKSSGRYVDMSDVKQQHDTPLFLLFRAKRCHVRIATNFTRKYIIAGASDRVDKSLSGKKISVLICREL